MKEQTEKERYLDRVTKLREEGDFERINDIFFLFVREGNLDICEALIKQGFVDINTKNSIDYNAVHYAAQWGHVELCKFLLKNKGNVNQKGSLGETPLHLAYFKKNTETINLLLEYGADPQAKCNNSIPEQWAPDYYKDSKIELTGLLGEGFNEI